jgi:hypothetical protein
MSIRACHKCLLMTRPCGGACPCKVDGVDIAQHVEAGYCGHPEGPRFGTADWPKEWPSRGLGDDVAKLINVVTLGIVKPCGGCKRRQAALNKLLPRTE